MYRSRSSLGVSLFLGTLLLGSLTSGPAAVAGPPRPARDRFIVVLKPGTPDPALVGDEQARRFRGTRGGVFDRAVRGFTLDIASADAAAVARDPRVAYVERDQPVRAFDLPTGVDRIEAEKSPVANIGGTTAVDVDIAIIDTGVAVHPDLTVVGGVDCSSSSAVCGPATNGRNDGDGHGTHVAGTAAARNGGGVVGVAPGARLWAVKVLDDDGAGSISNVIAGIDWATARAATIEVANMSLGCVCTSQALNDAITNSTAAGVVHVVAAGNDNRNASTSSPANHPNVITVSAMADFNGKPGKGATATCYFDKDDTRADFSNYGAVVDLAAPGVCIRSTWNNGGYNTISGTSMASPHATGAAALFIVQGGVGRTSSRWSIVREGLRSSGWSVAQAHACGFSGGKSSEPMLMVAACGSTPPPPVTTTTAPTTTTLPPTTTSSTTTTTTTSTTTIPTTTTSTTSSTTTSSTTTTRPPTTTTTRPTTTTLRLPFT